MKVIKFDKDYFSNFNPEDLYNWFKSNYNLTKYSALFTYRKNILGRTIKTISRKYTSDSFIPTHVGQIFHSDNFYILNMIPKKSRIDSLVEYLQESITDYRLVCFGNNKLNEERYINDIKSFNNRRYGYFSAIQSGIKCLKWIPNKNYHCSEILGLLLQNQGYFQSYKMDDLTPVEIYNLLLYNKTNIKL